MKCWNIGSEYTVFWFLRLLLLLSGSDNVCNPASGACRQGPNFVGRKGREEEKKREKKKEKKEEKKEKEKKRKEKKRNFLLYVSL